MDCANGLAASNRSIHPPLRNSNCSVRVRRRWLKQENIRKVGPDFDYIDPGSGYMAEWTSPLDLAY
jgi:hypothetical protein